MTDLSTGLFSEGTVSTDPSNPRRLIFSAMVGGVGGIVAGDAFYAGSASGLIASVDDNDAILAFDWTGGVLTDSLFAVQTNSQLRNQTLANNSLIRELLSSIASGKRYYNVSPAMAAPDTTVAPNPQLDERAIDTESTPWRLWKYDGMAWVLQPGAAGMPGPAGPATITADESVTTLDPGATPTFQNIGTSTDAVIHVGLPTTPIFSPGSATNLPAGSAPTLTFSGDARHIGINIGIPDGRPFSPNSVVDNIADRAAHDDDAQNTAILVASDSSNANKPTLYFKNSATHADWSIGVSLFASGTLLAANNLSDLVGIPAARANLGLGDLATKNQSDLVDPVAMAIVFGS